MDSINKLISKQSLDFVQSSALFDSIMHGQLSEIELTAVLIALKMKGECAQEIAGAANAMRSNAKPFNNNGLRCVDSCGTGGDGANTINVSTTAAIVAAACGLNVVKHGNRSVSSKSGSADLLKTLGINLDMSGDVASECLTKTGFTFLFAPNYHQGTKHAMPVRTALKTRTIFNILGPLANPAAPQVQLLGVYDPALCTPMAETLKTLGTERAMIVHGAGTDEIALHGETQVTELNQGELTHYTLNAQDFGLENYSLADIAGDTPEYNAKASLNILKGQGKDAHNAAIAANVAALLVMEQKAESFKEATAHVLEVLASGRAYQKLTDIVEVSNHG
ncbi:MULTISPECIES: anthranilate phosphoribosyltransferase [Pseudoalteromonas]|uniref:Anthranilate phosphoribosyltransferase n=1 Tax=Pseudoalteromonas amylolytica TaxID=1859457 RepID=A0A1S1MRU1_9GAMM|nr:MULTISPECIES: anthranilate phosphoribosyltransferase [Pseudoalteromonas]OHU86511.1 anthranilate phosphoribosyltransferase [Pseudoalteromonas sp. JW3]OHU88965.1 anthranilate phosphoribosyltransferase [Pseudoalteromonas amylolytica]